ncbi:MAG TPA: GNAT family N-acetyltransferase [Rhodanobacteraceae bacterium]
MMRHFMAHPPQGFEVAYSTGDAPVFSTRFDLLTTADAAWRERVRSWPGFRHWQRLLQPRTCFVGSTVSEYAWLPRHAEPDRLANDLVAAHGRRYPFFIIKDLPQDSPLLSADDNAWNDAFAAACERAGFVLLEGQALAWVPIDFADADAYLARLSRGARRNIRRKLRVREELEIERLPTGCAAFDDDAFLAEIHALYDSVYAQSELHFDYLDAGFFRAVLRDKSCAGVVFTYRHAGRLIGWNLCFEHAGMLVDKYIGLRYPDAHAYNLYAVSWMHNIEYARRRGLRFYVAGWSDPEIKAHLGAHMTFTRHAVRPRNPLVRLALRHLAPHFESDRQWFEEREHASDRA